MRASAGEGVRRAPGSRETRGAFYHAARMAEAGERGIRAGMAANRPHVLGIDDAPFRKGQPEPVPIVGVTMEGADLVEAIAVTRFPVDGEGATDFLAGWVRGLRVHASLQAVVLGGITLAGLSVVDLRAFALALELPVLAVTRRAPVDGDLVAALHSAGFSHRVALVEGSPRARSLGEGLHVACAGIEAAQAAAIVRATLRKARVPEPLRLAHLVGAALVQGESRGRV